MDSAIDGPVIVGANWYRFRPAERITHPRVLSRCFIWPVSGRGRIVTAGREFHLDPGTVLRLPWNHDIDYRADSHAPFEVGTIHLVPHHASDTPVQPRVAHLSGDRLLTSPARSGGRESPASLHSSATGAGARLIELGAVGIRRFDSMPYVEEYFRMLAQLILLEEDAATDLRPSTTARGGSIDAMVRFVAGNLDRPLSVEDVAGAGDCSTSTAQRLFSTYENCSVQQFVRRRKMDEAASLLRSTSLRVGEVAALVGFDDPLHFSRVFRAAYGLPPSRFVVRELRP